MKRNKSTIIKAYSFLTVMLVMSLSSHCQYATHSVLRNGNWWKVAIAEDGIYRLSASDIQAFSGTKISDIAIYGHNGGKFDEDNSSPRIDDLEEIPIEIRDNNNNSIFDANDYILFYATGSSIWVFDSLTQRYNYIIHPYSKYNYVYVSSSSGNHKRISSYISPEATGNNIESYHALRIHNVDQTNTHQSGQIWVGERFYGNNVQQTIHITLPAAPTGNISVRYALASVSTASSSFTISLNGQSRQHNFSKSVRYTSNEMSVTAFGSATLNFNLEYQYREGLANGYLDFIEVDATVPMTMNGDMMLMYVPAIDGSVCRHILMSTTDDTRIWDVTDMCNTKQMILGSGINSVFFNATTEKSHTYIAFNNNSYKTPVSIVSIDNQDLHGATNPDLVIVCHPSLQSEALRLASLHSIYDDMEVLTVTPDEVYNEFSNGQSDPIAIREMLRMFWKRWQSDNTLRQPRYLLLFGKGSYDNKNILESTLPTVITFQSVTSFDDEGTSYATDDIFGYLEDNESGRTSETLEVAIGRLPAKSLAEAAHLVDKIENYINRSDLSHSDIRGDWRNCVTLLADDADPSCVADTNFTYSSEITARLITTQYPQYTIDKIYADAYVQQSGADGSYYPDVNNALKKRIDYGCLLLNYIGHGSSQYIGTERFMMKSDISGYSNFNQLPMFITSTCSFGRYDLPGETCGAEEFLLAEGAGIACIAASRPISHVQSINTDMCMQALNPENRIGDAIMLAKNHRSTSHALTLMGDPALRLSFPTHNVVVTTINGNAVVEGHADSAKVLSTVTIEGEIRDANGNIVSDFDGVIYPEVYDRVLRAVTLANDNEGCEVSFTQQNNLLYKGRAPVVGGRFSYSFVVPRDVAYKYEAARLCHYAKSSSEDATGAYTNLYLGGFDESVNLTECHPEINLYINDTNFRDGGITDENPTLLVTLFDSIGINAVGSGLGHDITATLDGNANTIIVLNDFYSTDIDNELRGSIRYSLSNLTSGMHTITVKAWNIYNFSSTATLTFLVRHSDTAATADFITYPNPATDNVWLRMEHNCKGNIETAQIDIFNSRGQQIYTIHPSVSNDSYVIGPVRWDTHASNGQHVPPGIYIARCTITTSEGERLTEHQKIIIR
ncbi:MAG: type IX secretion system sortase PorU [Bacteroidales bacterium]|nr:type IX secretion system sortase PorU [Bacteroidales bacterium]